MASEQIKRQIVKSKKGIKKILTYYFYIEQYFSFSLLFTQSYVRTQFIFFFDE